MSQLVGMCGLVCSECEAYVATQAGDAEAIARITVKWNEEYHANNTPETIWCDGCTTAGARKCGHCAECAIRACGLERGLTTCAECDDYRCEKLSSFLQAVPVAEQTLEARRGKR